MMEQPFTAAMDPVAYRSLFERIVTEGEPYGPPGSGYGADYTKLNLARTRRLEKTFKPLPEVAAVMAQAAPQTWLVITEPWCGDSAQNLPVIQLLAALAPAIEVRIALRDTNLALIDRYLTNGARSIPKLVAFDALTNAELFQWGPRPVAAHDLVMSEKSKPVADQLSKEALAEHLHRWYNTNAGHDTQLELATLVGKRQS